jgi:hypothetical protein
MTDFYGIKPGTVPGFAETGAGRFMSVQGLPDRTVLHMLTFMQKLRSMYETDPLAFEVCIRHVATVIEDQRREEGKDDPRADPASPDPDIRSSPAAD